MFFVGYTFFGGKFSSDPTPVGINNIKEITLSNGIYDSLYISSNPSHNLSNKEWDLETLLYAKFDGNLLAGNVDFSVNTVSSIVIKRKRKNTFDEWLPLFEIQIDGDVNNFKFERFDKYVANQVEYEYALIPTLNGVEGSYNINTIIPNFEGLFIVSKDKIFSSILDNDIQVQRNKPTSVVPTIDSKYPFVISHSKNNYYSGSATATFIEHDHENNKWKIREGYDYRRRLLDFLLDGKPKMLKSGDTGEVFLIMVSDNIPEDRTQFTDKVTTTIPFTEVGNSEDLEDLINSGLVDSNLAVRQ